jgi:hypothetical protein
MRHALVTRVVISIAALLLVACLLFAATRA